MLQRKIIHARRTLVVLLLYAATLTGAENSFKRSSGVEITGDELVFRTPNSFAEPEGMDSCHLKTGLTIAAAVKLPPPPAISGIPTDSKGIVYNMDIIASRGSEFVFGRYKDAWVDQLYFNYSVNGKWAVPLVGTATIPAYDRWVHLAVTAEYYREAEQGLEGYILTFYVDGESVSRQVVSSLKADLSGEKIRIGSGFGIRGDQWSWRGSIAELLVADRAMNGDEIIRLAEKSKYVKAVRAGIVELSKEATGKFDAMKMSASPCGQWLIDAVRSTLTHGYEAVRPDELANRLAEVGRERDPHRLAERWNRFRTGYRILATSDALLLVGDGEGRNGFPIAGLYDVKRQRPVFGKRPLSWELLGWKNNDRTLLRSHCASWIAESRGKEDGYSGKIVWNLPDTAVVTSRFTFQGARLEMDLQVDNRSGDLLLDEVRFPIVRLYPLHNGMDYFLYPRQSGVAYPKPMMRSLPPPTTYPKGTLNMQFTAYYDPSGGIYLAQEDPNASLKTYTVKISQGELESGWRFPVAFQPGQKGGNSFRLPGNSVFELFGGDWFEAGQIYKRFVSGKAKWWIRELPRTATPEWYRNNTMTILQYIQFSYQSAQKDFDVAPNVQSTIRNAKLLRDYLELPYQIFFFGWEDLFKGDWPHFQPKDNFYGIVAPLHKLGIRCKIYTNPRRWSTMDGPGRKKDWMFTSQGRPCAIKDRNGALFTEDKYYAVMCPAAKFMQQWVMNYSERFAKEGFDNIYFDQVPAANPHLCFDPGHGHPLNSPDAWNELGCWKMFESVRGLKKQFPEVVFSGEDAAENMISCFDGFYNWRWLDEFQVPLFASIYAGRVQFQGVMYDDANEESVFYVKSGLDLAYAQQLGSSLQFHKILNRPRVRLHLKRMMHLRLALLSWFNGAEMAKPLPFKSPLRKDTRIWWDWSGKHPVTHPQVLNTVWKHPDGRMMILFLNTSSEPVTVEPVLDRKGQEWAVCNGDNASVKYLSAASPVRLKPLGFEIWLTGAEKTLKPEAENLQKDLRRIENFTPGYFPNDPIVAENDGFVFYGEVKIQGNGKFNQKGWTLPVKPERIYTVSFEIRKSGKPVKDPVLQSLVTGYEMPGPKYNFTRAGVFGAQVNPDGQWHKVAGTFKTVAGFSKWNLGIYNSYAEQDSEVEVRNLRISLNP